MSRTVRNVSLYAKKKRNERSKLSKKYRDFKQGINRRMQAWTKRPDLTLLQHQQVNDAAIAIQMQGEVAA